MLAQMSRTFTFTGVFPPTGRTSCSWSARRSFFCISRSISPISSRKSVPPSACSKNPFLFSTAPVKEPFMWPKNSLSMRGPGIAPQFTGTKGLPLRAPL